MVIWSQPAKADLKYIHDFIAQDSRHYAKKVAQEIKAKVDTLNEFPRIGNKVPEINDEGIRELHLYSYRIIYEIKASDSYVLAVAHTRRDFNPDELP